MDQPKELLLDYLQSFCERNDPPPTRRVEKLRFHQIANGWEQLSETVEALDPFLRGFPSEEEMSQIDTGMKSNVPNWGKMFQVGGQGARIDAPRVLPRLIFESYTEEDGQFTTSPEIREQAVDRLLETLGRNSCEVEYYSNLERLQGNFESFEFPNGVLLRKLQPEEFSERFMKYGSTQGPSLRQYVLQGSWIEENIWEESEQASFEKVEQMNSNPLRALRCLKDGVVAVRCTTYQLGLPFPLMGGTMTFSTESLSGQTYKLEENELEGLRRLSDGFENLKRPREATRQIDIAVQRLSEARLRRNTRDKVMDCVIALETLLVQDGHKDGQIRYKFGVHYGALGETFEVRNERRKLAQRLYDFRSALAHGREPDTFKFEGKELTPPEIAAKALEMAEEIVQMAVLNDRFKFWDGSFWYSRIFGDPSATL